MGRNGPRRAGSPKGSFRALMRTLAVLALAIQCLVIQTHIDAPAYAGVVASAQTQAVVLSAAHDQGQGSHRLGGDCIICQAAANARVGLVAPTMVLRLAEPVGLPIALHTVSQQAPRAPAHAWQSRAPPIQL